jgi:hypothetical protein
MERVAVHANLMAAAKRVNGNPGVDGMAVDAVDDWLSAHGEALLGATIDIGVVDVDGVELRRAVGPDPRDQGPPVAHGRHHAFAWVAGGGGRSGQRGLQAGAGARFAAR